MTDKALPLIHYSQGQPLRLGRELGRGGQGAVALVQGRPELVAKVYLEAPDAAQVKKLSALVQARTPALDVISAWPLALLHSEKGSPNGFLMPLVDQEEFRELHSLYSPGSRRKYFPEADWAFLVHVARNVARAFATLHDAGHLMGDVSGRNVVVSPQGTVRLLDTDSFQVRLDGEVFPCPVGTAEFTPPELQGQGFGTLIRTPDHDQFGLAVLIFQLLFEGRHPYAGLHASGAMPSPAEAISRHSFAYSRRPHPGVRQPPGTLNLSSLPPELQDLIERAFAAGTANRPSAHDWERALASLSEHLTTCPQNPAHKHFKDAPCPWCHLHKLILRASPVTAGLLAGRPLDVRAELSQLWRQVAQVRPPHPPQPAHLLTAGAPLPALPLTLPPKSKLSLSQAQRVNTLKWLLRAGTVVALLGAVLVVQRSPLSGLALLAAIGAMFALRGRVDWDGMIEKFGQWEGRVLTQAVPEQRGPQTHWEAVTQQQRQIKNDLEALVLTQGLLEERYARESAQAQYRVDLAALEDRRERLLAAQKREGQAVSALIERHERRERAEYLKRQLIKPGAVPNLGQGLVLHLASLGIVSAYDVEAKKLYGVIPGHWVKALLNWRRGLEAFFQFDPGRVPQAELDEVRRSHQGQLASELKQLEKDVQAFVQASWGSNEQALIAQIRDTKAQIIQHQEALGTLNRLSL